MFVVDSISSRSAERGGYLNKNVHSIRSTKILWFSLRLSFDVGEELLRFHVVDLWAFAPESSPVKVVEILMHNNLKRRNASERNSTDMPNAKAPESR